MFKQNSPTDPQPKSPPARKPRRRWRKFFLATLLLLGVVLLAGRLALPNYVRWHVNRVIDQNPLYDGKIGEITISLWRGQYSIADIRLLKTTGNVPVPFFAAKRMDLAIQWDALLNRQLVGEVIMEQPELNFVDDDNAASEQSDLSRPWLWMIQDLFPFDINRAQIHNGSIHLRAFNRKPQVNVYLSQVQMTIENLTNIYDETTPLISTVKMQAMAMDQARLDYEMKLDPFSYRPTFQMAVRLIGLDVTKLNELALAYGGFDFEAGYFDLIVEVDAKEGSFEGYVKPLFRKLKIFNPGNDLSNPIQLFWEALLGTAQELLKNQPRDQFATLIPMRGDLSDPRTDILSGIGNILYNAFIRAYLPRLQGKASQATGIEFSPGSIIDPDAPGFLP